MIWRIQGGVEDALQGLHRDRIGREVSDLPAAADETIDHLALRGAIRPLQQLCQRFVHDLPLSSSHVAIPARGGPSLRE